MANVMLGAPRAAGSFESLEWVMEGLNAPSGTRQESSVQLRSLNQARTCHSQLRAKYHRSVVHMRNKSRPRLVLFPPLQGTHVAHTSPTRTT